MDLKVVRRLLRRLRRLRIAMDLDGVVADIHPAAIKWLKTNKRVSVTEDKIVSWSWLDRRFRLTKAEASAMYSSAWIGGAWASVPTVEPLTKTYLSSLSKRHDLSIVTAAATAQISGKVNWIRNVLGMEDIPITIVPYGDTKEEMPYDVYVDDRAETIERVVKLGKVGFLFDRQWNRSCGKGIRISSLREVVEMLDSGRRPRRKA